MTTKHAESGTMTGADSTGNGESPATTPAPRSGSSANAATSTRTSGNAKSAPARRTGAARDVEMVACWVLFAAMIVLNTLAVFGVLAAAKHDGTAVSSWFTPDSYVQLVWIPVYALLAIWLVRLGNTKRKSKRLAKTPFGIMGLLFCLTALADIAWILSWTAVSYPLAVLFVLACTVLVGILGFFSRRHDPSVWGWAPFSLFGSWMLVETVSDIFRAVVYYVSKDGAISGGAQAASTVVLVVLLLGLGILAKLKLHDWIFNLVVLWSTLGIATHLMDVSKATGVVLVILGTVAAAVTYIPWQRVSHRLDQAAR
ncbi:hypothetical protein [Bifidobacterium choloepi]|uniref:hypothetical protein n=1 Tax=Bifidobacterium choloepi TaxID=2614131 RepID=UPI0013D1BF0E|nr:hypothetical protein [Bifidobacterium choloepi]